MQGKPYDNRLKIKGWVTGGRWGLERYLYTLHRITGLGLLAYFLLHILVTSTRAFGPDAWKQAMESVSAGFFKFGEFLVFLAFAFHAFNGLRLILVEWGIAIGKAKPSVYPYRTSVMVQRPLMIVVMVFAGIVIILGGMNFFAD